MKKFCASCGHCDQDYDGLGLKCKKCNKEYSAAFKGTKLPNNPLPLDDIKVAKTPTFIKAEKSKTFEEMEAEDFSGDDIDILATPQDRESIRREIRAGLNESDIFVTGLEEDGDVMRGVKFVIPPSQGQSVGPIAPKRGRPRKIK